MRWRASDRLAAETVQSAALALEGVDDVHGGDGLALGVLGVGDRVADHVLEEHLEDTSGFFVDEARDTLHTTSTGETADGGLGDALDVVAKHLSVTLGASLAETLASLTTARHDCLRIRSERVERRSQNGPRPADCRAFKATRRITNNSGGGWRLQSSAIVLLD